MSVRISIEVFCKVHYNKICLVFYQLIVLDLEQRGELCITVYHRTKAIETRVGDHTKYLNIKATGNNMFTELTTNASQRNGFVVFGVLLVSLLGLNFFLCINTYI